MHGLSLVVASRGYSLVAVHGLLIVVVSLGEKKEGISFPIRSPQSPEWNSLCYIIDSH